MAKTPSPRPYNTKDMVWIALFAVLIAICSWLSIPTAIPFTMQTFAVYLTLTFLGAGRGTMAVCVYLMLGLIGLPVFSGFTSGLGVLLGTHGGYMMGWLLSGLVMGGLERLLGRTPLAQALSMLAGLLVCYAAGTVWFVLVYAGTAGRVGFQTALLWCVVPFILPDLLKLGLALWVCQRLQQWKKVRLM